MHVIDYTKGWMEKLKFHSQIEFFPPPPPPSFLQLQSSFSMYSVLDTGTGIGQGVGGVPVFEGGATQI